MASVHRNLAAFTAAKCSTSRSSLSPSPTPPASRPSTPRLLLNQSLPYARWLDYCAFSYVVSEDAARDQMARVVETLAALSDREIAAKRRDLAAVRPAFVMRRGGCTARDGPCASQYVLEEACHTARRLARGGGEEEAMVDVSRCTLGLGTVG